MKSKYLILIRGLSGSGKTTLADIICGDSEERVSISVDDYFYDEDTNSYKFIPEHLKEAHEWCRQESDTCMAQGFETVVIHNTFTRRWEVEPYLESAARHKYQVIVTSLYDAGLTDIALATRSEHGIDTRNVRQQRKRWDADVFRSSTADRRPRRQGHR